MRYYVETSDEFGPVEIDSFSTPEEAMKEADLVAQSHLYAVVVDRVEMVAIAKVGVLPKSWL